jgi:branched-chain amino acid transport system ATP-binding protein
MRRLTSRKTSVDDLNAFRVEGATVDFGGVKALTGVDVALTRGEVVGLIGPNGAGKTTLINVATGFIKTEARMTLGNETVSGMSPQGLARRGIARTFQDGRLFKHLSVIENIEVSALQTGFSRRAARRTAWEFLEWSGLAGYWLTTAGALPYGDSRRVGVLRALASRPAFLFLDEPAAGLNAEEANALMQLVARAATDFQCGVLVVEHNVPFVMELCARIQVLNYGRTICFGTPADVRSSAEVIQAYLGSRRKDRQDHAAD